MEPIESNTLFWLCLWLLLWHCYLAIHELGHGIMALLLTKEEVDIYLGTHMQKENTVSVCIGRLSIYMLYKPPIWMRGCCHFHGTTVSANRQIAITLAGSIVPLAIALLLFFPLSWNAPLVFSKVSGIFLLYSLFGVITSLIPSKTVYGEGNDGNIIRQIWRQKRYPRQWGEAMEHFQGERYSQAADGFMSILGMGIEHEDIYRCAIAALLRADRDEETLALCSAFEQKYTANANDYATAGVALLRLHRYEEGLVVIDKGLEIDPGDALLLGNRSHALTNLGRYEEALADICKAIEIDSNNALWLSSRSSVLSNLNRYEEALADINRAIELEPDNNAFSLLYRSYTLYRLGRLEEALVDINLLIDIDPNMKNAFAGRAFIEIDLGKLDEAWSDIQRTLAIDENYSEAYNALGRYYLAKHDYKTALKNFERAYSLDNKADDIERYLALAREKVAAEAQQA